MKTSELNWIQPQTIEELQGLMNDQSSSLIIFKHSTRCPTSRFALKNFERDYNLSNTRTVMINVLTQRELSNFVADSWNIEHESPQTVLQNTKGEHSSFSHSGIEVQKIDEFLNA